MDEAAVDFHLVHGHAREQAQRRVARSEIVDRQIDTERGERGENAERALGIPDEAAFGQFQRKQAGRQLMSREQPGHARIEP